MRQYLSDGRSLAPTAFLVAGALAIGSLVPVLRDALVAARLGASADSDAYFLSTYVAVMVVTILVSESATPAAVVTLSSPSERSKSRGLPLPAVLGIAGLVLVAVTLLTIVLAGPLVDLLAPGFGRETASITVNATIVVAPAIALLGLAWLVSAYLNAAGHFLFPAMMTPIVAVGASLPLLAGTDSPVVAASGWTIGAGAALLILTGWAVFVTKTGRHSGTIAPRLDMTALTRLAKLAAPLVMIVVISQSAEIADRVISSGIDVGALTSIALAKKTMSLPNTILVAAVGAVTLPYLSRQYEQRTRSAAFIQTVNLALFFLLPVTMLLVLARSELVAVLYGRGEFGSSDVELTASLLGIYAFALIPVTLSVILQRSFATLNESRSPLLPYALALGGYIAAAWAGSRVIGLLALPLTFAIAEMGYVATLLAMLHRHLRFNLTTLAWPAGIALAGTLLCIPAVLLVGATSGTNAWIVLGLKTSVAGAIYTLFVLWLRHPAASDILNLVRGRPDQSADDHRLRVAIESTYAASNSGTGRYVSSLIQEFHHQDDLELLLFRAPRVDRLPRFVRLPLNGGLHVVWLQVVFPVWAWRHRVDIIHTSMAAPLFAPCPVVVTIHDGLDFHPEWRPSGIWSAYVRSIGARAARRADSMIVVSEAAASEVRATFGIPMSKLRVIWNGSGLAETSQSRPAVTESLNGRYVLAVGSATRRKNIETAIAAVEQTRNTFADVELVLVGHAPDTLTRERPWLHVAANVADSELAWLYAHASAVIVPSRHEGFGLPVLEGLSFGIPVVGSDIPALREVGGKAAHFASPENPAEFADHLVAILKDPETERARISAASQVASTHTWAWTAEQVIAVYREIIDRNEGGRAWLPTAAS